MMTCTANQGSKSNYKDLVACLMNAWAMDEPAVQRTLNRTAKEEGVSVEDLAESHVLQLDFVAELLAPADAATVVG